MPAAAAPAQGGLVPRRRLRRVADSPEPPSHKSSRLSAPDGPTGTGLAAAGGRGSFRAPAEVDVAQVAVSAGAGVVGEVEVASPHTI